MSGTRPSAAIEAAIFDLDGLLIDSEPLWQDAEMEVFGELGLRLRREECLQTTGLRTESVVAYWLERRPWDAIRFPLPDVVARINQRVIDRIGDRATPKEGVAHALDFVAARGMRLALASSSSMPVIETALRRLAIADRFEVVHSADFEARSKPHPDVYLGAAARLDVAPHGCVAFEDSLPGVAAAKAAGMLCVRIPEQEAGPAESTSPPAVDGQMPATVRSPSSGADLVLASLADLDETTWNNLLSLPTAPP